MHELVKNLTLITGAARSGKSRYAEKLAMECNAPVVYIATMQRIEADQELEQRIAEHRARRPKQWVTVESPNKLPEAIDSLSASAPASAKPDVRCCIIDCLSIYVSNILVNQGADQESGTAYEKEKAVSDAVAGVLEAIEKQPGVRFLVVTNETGWGVVPNSELGRAFRDMLGTANQRFAEKAEEVWLTCVGLPLQLKPAKHL
jgi:adenosylcobinamide kinase / adenosylcobinamide-phosphate guanylyltransferase